MKLLGKEISAAKVMAAVTERLASRGLDTSSAAEFRETAVEPRVDPLSFNVHALEENADATRGLPLETHRDGLAGRAVTMAKRVFRQVGQIFINEALGRQTVFNGHVRDSYSQLSAEVLRLRTRVAELENAGRRVVSSNADASLKESVSALAEAIALGVPAGAISGAVVEVHEGAPFRSAVKEAKKSRDDAKKPTDTKSVTNGSRDDVKKPTSANMSRDEAKKPTDTQSVTNGSRDDVKKPTSANMSRDEAKRPTAANASRDDAKKPTSAKASRDESKKPIDMKSAANTSRAEAKRPPDTKSVANVSRDGVKKPTAANTSASRNDSKKPAAKSTSSSKDTKPGDVKLAIASKLAEHTAVKPSKAPMPRAARAADVRPPPRSGTRRGK